MFFFSSTAPGPKAEIGYEQIVVYAEYLSVEAKASYNKGIGLSPLKNLTARTCLHDLVNLVMDMRNSTLSEHSDLTGPIYLVNHLENLLNEICAIREPAETLPVEASLTYSVVHKKKIIKLEPKLDSLNNMLSFLVLITQKPIRFELNSELPPEVCFNLDWEVLSRTLINLATNALKSMDNGTITISIKAGKASGTETDLQILVDDTGRGIPKKIRATIFDLKDVTRDEPCGQGLGLHFCKMAMAGVLDFDTLTAEEAVLRAAGDTTINSQRESPGTTFRGGFNCEYFPGLEATDAVGDAIAKTCANIRSYKHVPETSARTSGGAFAPEVFNINDIKALFIEDTISTIKMIQRFSPHTWQFKTNANEFMSPSLSLKKYDLEIHAFDIIIIDNNLGYDSVCTGFGFAIAARTAGFAVPIIIASGDDDLAEMIRMSGIENCSHLGKPYDFSKVEVAIQKVVLACRSTAPHGGETIVSSDAASAPLVAVIGVGKQPPVVNELAPTVPFTRPASSAAHFLPAALPVQPTSQPIVLPEGERPGCCLCM